MSKAEKETVTPERIPHADVVRMRAAAPKPITRKFYLDSPMGVVEVTVKGPAGASKLKATESSLVISTGADLPEEVAPKRSAKAAPRREMSGNADEPGGTSVDSLPGDDEVAEKVGRGIEAETLKFLSQTEKAILHKNLEE